MKKEKKNINASQSHTKVNRKRIRNPHLYAIAATTTVIIVYDIYLVFCFLENEQKSTAK